MTRIVTRWFLLGALWSFSAVPGALGQGNGNSGGKGSKPSQCVDDAFQATLRFMPNPEADYWAGPAIYPSDGGATLSATVAVGNVVSGVENESGDDLPVHLDLSEAPNDYPVFHSGVEEADVDPFVSTFVRTNDANLDGVECQMFGMEPDGSTPYRMRLTLQWWELSGAPVPREADSDKRWVLRYKPVSSGDPTVQLTWLDAVRKDANTWLLTSRPDSDPPHFASLERDGSKGKIKEEKSVSKPVMPLELVITVDCGGDCPTPQ